mmetsp:Transcript_25363/g.22487  ORF Transcript_25363/g.22487 Transcript_25363/m.22487 type:complete len:97 (-) Transcript_25363:277-567(-)
MQKDLPSSMKGDSCLIDERKEQELTKKQENHSSRNIDISTDNDLSTIKEMESMETKQVDDSVFYSEHDDRRRSSKKKRVKKIKQDSSLSKYINYSI